MSFSFTLEISLDTASPDLAAWVRRLEDLTRLHEMIGERVENLTRRYLAAIATERHATADRLGASPTGALSRAAESPEAKGTRDSVILTMRPAEILARAFRDVEIVPRAGKKWLTIPVHHSSYGKRAGEFSELHFVFIPDENIAMLVQRAANGNTIPLFLLVRKVTQKQDRTLLPSDEAFLAEMEAAAEDLLLESSK